MLTSLSTSPGTWSRCLSWTWRHQECPQSPEQSEAQRDGSESQTDRRSRPDLAASVQLKYISCLEQGFIVVHKYYTYWELGGIYYFRINYLVYEVPLVRIAFLKSLHDSNSGSIFQSHSNDIFLN